MVAALLLLAMSLPAAEVDSFAARVAQAVVQALGQAQQAAPGTRVLLHIEDPGATGASDQLNRALRESLRARNIEAAVEGELPWQVHVYLSRRRGRPLAVARIAGDGREAAVLFAVFSAGAGPEAAPAGGPALAIRTRTLLTPDLPVLDIEADAAGNLFVLHADRVRVFDLNAAGLPMKAEVGLDTGAEHLRDPLLRMLARDNPRQLEIYSAAFKAPPLPPLPIEGYTLKGFTAPAKMRLPHTWRAVSAVLQLVAGKNYFSAAALPEIDGLAPVLSPLRAHWAVLEATGRLQLTDADMRPMAAVAAGTFGGDIASATLPCAGTVLLAASADVNPARDRIAVLRVENDAILPYTSVEIDGAVRRLKALPASGDQRRVLAISQVEGAMRIEEIEMRCAP